MADPLSLVAIAGLAYAGKVLSEKKKTEEYNLSIQQAPVSVIQEEVPNVMSPKPVSRLKSRLVKLVMTIVVIARRRTWRQSKLK